MVRAPIIRGHAAAQSAEMRSRERWALVKNTFGIVVWSVGAASRVSEGSALNLKQLVLAIFTVVALSAGQVLFKLSAENIDFSREKFFTSILSPKILLALFVYAIATLLWLALLKTTPLRIAYPFAALAFLIVPILAHFFLGEPFRMNTAVGALLIFSGVWISVFK